MGNKQEHSSEKHHHHHHISLRHHHDDDDTEHHHDDLEHHHNGLIHHHLELDRSEHNYLPNEIVSGHVLHTKRRRGYVSLTGTINFEKHKRSGTQNCQIVFYSARFDLIPSITKRQIFQFQLNEHLPPSFNNLDIIPNISYSVNLIYRKSSDEIYFSIPIRVCPIVKIDQPILLSPLFFGPIENTNYNTKLEVKLNRTAFTFNDTIQINYELQNPNECEITKIHINLGAYYLIESNIRQDNIINNSNSTSTKDKLIKNEILLKIPNDIYLPPTFKYTHNEELFHLTIDYKIQFQIYLENSNNLWEIDVPIILCHELIEAKE